MTFSLVSFAWIFFRADSIGTAFTIIRKMGSGLWHTAGAFFAGNMTLFFELLTGPDLGIGRVGFLIAILSIVLLEIFHGIQRHGSIRHMLRGKPAWFRWTLYYAVIIMIAVFGVFQEVPFIYFQF